MVRLGELGMAYAGSLTKRDDNINCSRGLLPQIPPAGGEQENAQTQGFPQSFTHKRQPYSKATM